MPRAKRSPLVTRFSTAAPWTLGTNARRVTKATRKNKTNFCILSELFFSVDDECAQTAERRKGQANKKARTAVVFILSWNREFVIPVEYDFVINSPFHRPVILSLTARVLW